MGQTLRILMVEDSQDDVILLQYTLRSAGYDLTCKVVDTQPAMRAALLSLSWDVITSDHSMPQFSAPAALALSNEICPDVPFIILSGEIDLNLAVSLMRGGAKDYIQKRELPRLIPSIERELREVELRREQQRVDAALKDSNERLREVMENSLDAFYKRNLLTNSYEYFSPVMARITGYTSEEMNSMAFETVVKLVHPDDIQELKRVMVEAISGGGNTANQAEYRLLHKQGHYLWLQDRFTVLRNPGGQPSALIGSVSDITERKRASAELEALLEIMQGLAVTKDLHEILALIHHSVAKVIYAENFFVVFYNKEIGLFEEVYSVDQYDPPAPPSRLEKSITAHVFRSGKPQIMTQALFNELEAQGEVELVGTNSASWLGAPLNTPEGTIGVIVVQDYETPDRYAESDTNFLAYIGSQVGLAIERKQAEDQIRRLNAELEERVAERTLQLTDANRELEAFSYSVSHDLRAPLRALEGFSAVLGSDYRDELDAQGQLYLARIQEASRRMGQLIEDLLNLSRITRVDLIRQRVDLGEMANRIAAELIAQSPQRKVEFEITSQMIVEGDENLIKIVLENLLSNAFKFTSRCDKAIIQVDREEQEGEPVFYVRDNGAGFNMEYAYKLFGPFQRLHHVNEYPGNGIGLATVQRIIHRHGGRVWAVSEELKGATVYFTIGS